MTRLCTTSGASAMRLSRVTSSMTTASPVRVTCSRTAADALVPQDEETLVLLEFATDDQGEVEQQAADDEIREAEEEQRGYELHVQSGRRHVRELQGTGVDAVAPEQRDHLAAHIHQ